MTKAIGHGSRNVLGIVIVLVSGLGFSWSQAASPPQDTRGETVIRDENRPPAHLIFACDSRTSELKTLFSPQLLGELHQINGGVALSTEDFSADRTQAVRQLNAAGIPAVAVIVLDQNDGYYVNADNAPATANRFAEFDKWSTDNGLRWEAVGLDIEPSVKEWSVINDHKLRFAGMILRKLLESNRRVYRARRAYADLIRQMQSRGYYVQTYQLPLIANERRAHSTVLEKILGLVDVRGDQEVLMLYTSFNPGLGAAIISQYGPQAQAIAIGSTAGGATENGKFSALSWDEFSRDLIVAHHFSRTIGVYSLEGCIGRGYMPRLKTIDWNHPVQIPAASIRRAARVQNVIYCLLWPSRFWLYFAVLSFLLFAWVVRVTLRRATRRRGALRG
jgi:hypothetical protein